MKEFGTDLKSVLDQLDSLKAQAALVPQLQTELAEYKSQKTIKLDNDDEAQAVRLSKEAAAIRAAAPSVVIGKEAATAVAATPDPAAVHAAS